MNEIYLIIQWDEGYNDETVLGFVESKEAADREVKRFEDQLRTRDSWDRDLGRFFNEYERTNPIPDLTFEETLKSSDEGRLDDDIKKITALQDIWFKAFKSLALANFSGIIPDDFVQNWSDGNYREYPITFLSREVKRII